MSRNQLKVGLVFMIGLLLAFGASCASAQDFDDRLGSITKPYRFSTLKWESSALLSQARNAIVDRQQDTGDEVNGVIDYFSAVRRMRSLKSQIGAINAGDRAGDPAPLQAELDRLQPQTQLSKTAVERIIARQIRETLQQQGIFNPVDRYIGLKITFPPINFDLEEPPHLLAISPRDRIEKLRETTLQQGITSRQAESLEDQADKLGVSSLVIGLGGFAGTYPVFVTDQSGLRFAIETVAHEWLHQYLAFKPLGFAYLLDLTGISRNYDVATINETVASMFGREIASILYEKYYGREGGTRRTPEADSEFNREMREIRKAVDQYLAQGEIEQAEKFMEQKRQDLASRGYYIRKLNQAYFAFHGTYADSPTSISPIGSGLKKLRSQQRSLKDFLETVAVITSRQELIDNTQ